jgi:hypothetical protein
MEWTLERRREADLLLVRGLVAVILPPVFFSVGHKDECERLHALSDLRDLSDPHPFTQGLLVALRKYRQKLPLTSFVIFCALRAIERAYQGKAAGEWVAKAHLYSLTFFDEYEGQSRGPSVLIDYVVTRLRSPIPEPDPFLAPDPFG